VRGGNLTLPDKKKGRGGSSAPIAQASRKGERERQQKHRRVKVHDPFQEGGKEEEKRRDMARGGKKKNVASSVIFLRSGKVFACNL